MKRQEQSFSWRIWSVAILLLVAVAASFWARLLPDPSWSMLARAVCGAAFVASLVVFAAALPQGLRPPVSGADHAPSREGSTC